MQSQTFKKTKANQDKHTKFQWIFKDMRQ